MRVLLVSMPFGAVDRPALGISLLKAALLERSITCDIRYLFDDFVEIIGIKDYQWLTDEVPYTSFAGDWCFTLPLYGRNPDLDWAYVHNILRDTWAFSNNDIAKIVNIREASELFITTCLRSVDWYAYDVVGFTSTFVQNIASLALAKRLKDHIPHLKIIFGGANWEDDMGRALFESFPFVDYVCQGESDKSFPTLIEYLSKDRQVPVTICGILSRDSSSKVLVGSKAEMITDMDALPTPDFSDYFSMLQTRAVFAQVSPALLMETSRGCWWGAKHHCTFCGLNGNGMVFRSKKWERVLTELDTLDELWDIPFVCIVDNILDMSYFRTLLPALAKRSSHQQIFYETKANLSRVQVRLLSNAGINNIQPGIESLSDHILKLMRKGTTALRNIQLLKWCRELGINVDWNILYGFPGENDDDYATMLNLLSSIRHLQAPSGSGPIRLDRFSPYYETPEAFGLKNLRPMPVFQYLYPFGSNTIRRIACYFDFDYHKEKAPSQTAKEIIAYINTWSNDYKSGNLSVIDKGQSLVITDTRSTHQPTYYQLNEYERIVYLLCDEVTSLSKILIDLLALFPSVRFEKIDVQRLLESLTINGLMARDNDHYLSLGVFQTFPWNWKTHLMSQTVTDQNQIASAIITY